MINTGASYPNAQAATSIGQILREREQGHAFNVEKIENGFIVHYHGKKYMAEDLDSAMDRVKACIVEERLTK